MESKKVIIDYTDWKDMRKEWLIVPGIFFWGSTNVHQEPQWMLSGHIGSETETFAMTGIHSWRSA